MLIGDKTGIGDVCTWYRKTYAQLSGMQQRGIMQTTDEKYLAPRRSKAVYTETSFGWVRASRLA